MQHKVLMLLLVLFVGRVQAQSIGITSGDVCNNSNASSNIAFVKEGGAITLNAVEGTWAGTCTAASAYQWKKDGVDMTGQTGASLLISPFDVSKIGLYSVAISKSGCTAQAASFFLVMVPDPHLSILSPVSGLCVPANAPLQPTTAQAVLFETNQAGRGMTAFTWFIDGQSVSTSSGYNLTASYADYQSLIGGNTTLSLSVNATDAYGCEWSSAAVVVPIVSPRFTDYAIAGPVQLPTMQASDIGGVQWLTGWPNASINTTYTKVSGNGLLSGNMFYPTAAGTNIFSVSTEEAGCVYTAEASLEVLASTAIAFDNLTAGSNSTINNNREACAGDELVFASNNWQSAPAYVRLMGRNGTYIVVELAACDGSATPCAMGSNPIILSDTSINGTRAYLSEDVGYYNSATGDVHVLVPRNAETGAVCFYAGDPTAAGSSAIACLNSPSNLTVNNPVAGFALVKQPMCYTDEALLVGIPAGGDFWAKQGELNLDTTGTGRISAAGSFGAIDLDLLRVDSAGQSFLVGAAIQTSAGINDGGQMLVVGYDYLPHYTTGLACSHTITAADTLPVFDNRPISFGFPLVEYAPNASPLDLNNNINAISPALNGGNASNTSSYFVAPVVGYDFSGTFVQGRSGTGYNFLVAQAGIGQHPIAFSADNNGCEIIGNGNIYLSPKPEFVGLPGALCRAVDTVSFYRDANLRNRNRLDTIITCTPRTISVGTSLTDAPTKIAVSDPQSISNISQQLTLSSLVSFGLPHTKATLSNSLYICAPTSVVSVTEYEFVGLQVLNSGLDTIIAQSGVDGSMPTVRAGACGYNNPDRTNESYWIHFAHNGFANRGLVEVHARFRTISRSYPVDSFTRTGQDTYVIHSLDSAAVRIDTALREIAQQVELIQQASIQINNLPSTFCYNSSTLNVSCSPAYEPGFSSFMVQQIVPADTHRIYLVEDILDIQAIADSNSVNKIYEITYKYTKFYGCDTIAKDTFMIVAKQPTFFTGNTIGSSGYICLNGQEELLNGSPLPSSGLGGQFSGRGIGVNNQGQAVLNAQGDTIRNIFAPAVAGVGTHLISYTYTDLYGCQSTGARTITVRASPVAQLTTAGNRQNVCANETDIPLLGSPSTGGQGRYFGPTIIGDNIFHPNLAYLLDSAAASGGVAVYYSYRDTFGCSDTASLDINVRPLPVLRITGLAPRYCQNSASITNITASDLSNIPYSQASFRGRGIIGNRNFTAPQTINTSYSPSQAGVGLDTITYRHTNLYGCTDSISAQIRIDSAPTPRIQNLDSFYCINTSPIRLVASLSNSSAQFFGAGISGSSNNYIFTPLSAANAAGVNQAIVISYNFTDGNGCTSLVRDTTYIRPLPTATMNIGVGFCENAPAQQINYAVGSSVRRHFFSGAAVQDSLLGIISPPLGVQRQGYGLDTVWLSVWDSLGCANTISSSFNLYAKPNVAITGIDSNQSVCANSSLINVVGFPNGNSGALSSNIPAANFNLISSASGTIQPNSSLVGNNYWIAYRYTDINSCSDTSTLPIQFIAAPQPVINLIDSQFCENNFNVPLNASPAGAGNFFSGAGVSLDSNNNWIFNPFRAGSGLHNITYTAHSQQNNVTCTASQTKQIRVRPLPVPQILSPSNNASFCNTAPLQRLSGGVTNATIIIDSIFSGTGVRDSQIYRTVFVPNLGNVLVADTIFFFDPSRAQAGNNRITFVATSEFGCVDSAAHNFVIYNSPNTYFDLDSAFCESTPHLVLIGTPANGTFSIRGNNLIGGIYAPNAQYPQNLLNAPRIDTITYTVNTGGVCNTYYTRTTTVYPVPRLSFVSINQNNDSTNRSCLGADTLQLYPNVSGGQFYGAGLLYNGHTFYPHIAGVGAHRVTYSYTDPITSCSNSIADTIRVFNRPNLALAAIGGCGNDSLILTVNNPQLGLNGFFAGALYDSITRVEWDFGDGYQFQAPQSTPNNIDSIRHYYANAGAYTISVIVENQGLCSASTSLRTIVSPPISPTVLDPYFEDFEQSNGAWFDESENAALPSNLWAWGIARGNYINTNQNAHRHVWATNPNGPYLPNAEGWVYSPCFDLSQLDRPMIALDIFSNTDEGNDGVVIEYFDETQNAWLPLGNVNRGSNWYNRSVIAGRPGLQNLAPIGWSGEINRWTDARYALDEFRNYDRFRFRIAFGAVGVHNRGLEGFAFDNVWIGNRSRNVVLEHFANVHYPNMNNINQHVYDICFHSNSIRDVILLQYQNSTPGHDQFNDFNPVPAAARNLNYGNNSPNIVRIDGKTPNSGNDQSSSIRPEDFEIDMLSAPAVLLDIQNFQIQGNQISFDVNMQAAQALAEDDRILMVAIIEDSLKYSHDNQIQVHSVVRDLLPSSSGQYLQRSWAQQEEHLFHFSQTFDADALQAHHLQAVAFVQNLNTSEIYQAASTRDITLFLQALNTSEANPIPLPWSLKIYPNPASVSFTAALDAPLNSDADWMLVDVLGHCLQKGKLPQGSQAIEIPTHELSAGTYFFVLQDQYIRSQKAVQIYR